MTDNRILLHTSTSLLRACTRLLPFHLLLAALGGWRAHGLCAVIAWTLITLSLAWLHWRIAFDAAIFRRWLAVPDSDGFDRALHTLRLRRPRQPPPTLPQRCRGAARLCRQLLLMTLVQAAMTAVLLSRHAPP